MADAPYHLTEDPTSLSGAPAHPKALPGRDTLYVSLLGGFLIEAPNGSAALPSRKAQAILAYLLLQPTRSASRESIAGLLWSGGTEDLARASLRQALRRLNQYFEATGVFGIEVTRNEVRLNIEAFETDLWTVLECDADAPINPILLQRSDISSSLLLGFEDLDEAFHSWVLSQRQIMHDRLVADLEDRLGQRPGRAGPDATQVARNAALALSNLDPTHEGACRELMLQHVRAGDIGSALKRYNRLWSLLESDFDMEPSDETKRLVALIKSGAETNGETPDTSGATTDKSSPFGTPRLIINTFSDTGVPDAQKFMARAFRHQFMSSLLKFREWQVLDGERSQDHQRAVIPTVPTYAVSGEAFQKEAVLHVALSVRDMATDAILWSEENQASLETWPKTLKQLVQKLAVALNIHSATARAISRSDESTESSPVYDRWMQGRRLMHLWTPTSWSEAGEIFTSALQDQPDFAPAHSSLSFYSSLKRFVCPGYEQESELSTLALDHAKRSVDLGPRDAKSYQASGWAYITVGEYERAILCFGIAETLNENDIGVAVSSALGLAYCGETEEAIRRLEKFKDASLSYQSLHWSVEAACRFVCRDYSGTIWAAAKANEAAFYPQAWAAMAFAQLGNPGAAERETDIFITAARENWFGDIVPQPEDITRWFLSVHPFRRPVDFFHMKHCLQRAGLEAR